MKSNAFLVSQNIKDLGIVSTYNSLNSFFYFLFYSLVLSISVAWKTFISLHPRISKYSFLLSPFPILRNTSGQIVLNLLLSDLMRNMYVSWATLQPRTGTQNTSVPYLHWATCLISIKHFTNRSMRETSQLDGGGWDGEGNKRVIAFRTVGFSPLCSLH